MANSLVNNFEIPSWAGKPPAGLHLDVMKDTKMIQKLMIDEKKCYFFGRNKQLNDFCIDHASCSRVHSALIWHRFLSRPFIIDLNSTHGTYIGSIRLDSRKPQQVPLDSCIHFGASSRNYVIRERPQTVQLLDGMEARPASDEMEGGLLGLPETETELDNLTEFNTAHNRRIATISDVGDLAPNPLKRKRLSVHVDFTEDEEIINPEDIDPTIGRFRNLVQTTLIPIKKQRGDDALGHGLLARSGVDAATGRRFASVPYTAHLYSDIPASADAHQPAPHASHLSAAFSVAAKLGLRVPNLAPDIEDMSLPTPVMAAVAPSVDLPTAIGPVEPRKKKYAKEAWPGKKPTPALLV